MGKKIIAVASVIVLVIIAVPSYLLLSGTINAKSFGMILNVMTGKGVESPTASTLKNRFSLPDGFELELFASDLPKIRFLKFTPGGDLLVTRPHAGDVLLLKRDRSKPLEERPEVQDRITLLSGLKRPHGIELHAGWLYVAESDSVGRVRYNDDEGRIEGEYEIIIDGLTDNGNHWSKSIGVGPDLKLYLSQGSTCNVCLEEDTRRATFYRYELDGSGESLVATGLRNSVGFDWAPWSGTLYATDNGRDMLGDDYPPCELNAIQQGAFYGWPYFNGDNQVDPDMGSIPAEYGPAPQAPAHNFRAHNAPLGMRFVQNQAWPERYRRSALVALHGSWNRSTLDGYKVVSLHWNENGIEERDFLTGFEKEGDVIGRPVDIAQGPDGAVYVSDDYAGAIYRVVYGDAPQWVSVTELNERQGPGAEPLWVQEGDLKAMREQGEGLFQQHKCAACHLPGTEKMGLQGLHERLNHTDIEDILLHPRPPMPVFPLSEPERRALAVYLLGR